MALPQWLCVQARPPAHLRVHLVAQDAQRIADETELVQVQFVQRLHILQRPVRSRNQLRSASTQSCKDRDHTDAIAVGVMNCNSLLLARCGECSVIWRG